MICTCTHRNCYYVFHVKGSQLPDRCPDCGNRSVRRSTPEEISWFTWNTGALIRPDKPSSAASRFTGRPARGVPQAAGRALERFDYFLLILRTASAMARKDRSRTAASTAALEAAVRGIISAPLFLELTMISVF